MWKITKRIAVLVLIFTLATAFTTGVQAQGTPKPNIAALVFTADGKGATARIFEPKATPGRELFKINERMNAILSPDTNYAVMQGTIDDQGTFSATLIKSGTTGGTALIVPKDFTFVGGAFSATSKYFAYTLAKLPQAQNDPVQYNFVILDVASAKPISSTVGNAVYPFDQNGKANPLPASGFYGGPLAVLWLDDSRIVVAPFIPFTDGGMDGLFVVDASKAQANAIPPVTPLTKQTIPGNSIHIFAPDNSKIAYTFADPKRPIKAQDAMFGPFNSIAIVDVASGTVVNAAVPGDNVIGNGFTFSADTKKIYFTAGKYVDPASNAQSETRLYTADVATGQVTEGPVLLADKQTVVYQMLACGSTLYLSASKLDPNAATAQLIAAPVDNPTAQTVIYSGTGYTQLVSCAP
jgi:hypothetical protein